MTRTIVLAGAMALFAAVGAEAQHPHGADAQAAHGNVSGQWALSFEAPWGDVDMVLDLTQEDGRLRGFARWGSSRIMIDRGTVQGSAVAFSVMAGDGVTHQIEMRFEGTLREDRMRGTVQGWEGPAATWTARREGD